MSLLFLKQLNELVILWLFSSVCCVVRLICVYATWTNQLFNTTITYNKRSYKSCLVILKCLFNIYIKTLYSRHYMQLNSGCMKHKTSGYWSVLLKMDNKKPRHKIPPDGGWGWMIVLSNALSNVRFYHSLFEFFHYLWYFNLFSPCMRSHLVTIKLLIVM